MHFLVQSVCGCQTSFPMPMIPPKPPSATRESLRRLATPHALAFGTRLLHKGNNGVITFREFVAVARELMNQLPDQTAVYLAALVALDMGNDEEPQPRPHQPSLN
jgi:hypothetical protein